MVVLTTFTQPVDGIRHQQNNLTVYVNDNNLGKGTLYIAESRLSWASDSGNGFSIEYPHISLHAVSRDLSAFPHECIFLMLDTALGDEESKNGNGHDDENDNESDEQETTELRLVPDDRGMLDAMFHALNACQALHPDPEDSFSDEDFYEADDDDDYPMEETDSRMASLRIENMDERQHMLGRVGGRVGDRGVGRVVEEVGAAGSMNRALGIRGDEVEDLEEDTEVDMEEDKEVEEVGTKGTAVVGKGVDMAGGTAADMAGDTAVGISVVGRVVGKAVGKAAGMAGDTAGGISVEGRGVDMAGGTAAGTSVVGRGVDKAGGMEVDMAGGMGVGISAVGRGVDMAGGTVAGTLEDLVEDKEAGISEDLVEDKGAGI